MTFSRRWLILLALGAIPLLMSGVSFGFVHLTLGWYGLLIVLAVADWLRFPHLAELQIERDVNEVLSLEAENEVRVRITNGTGIPLRLELRDSPPEAIPSDLTDAPFLFMIAANARQAAVYHLTPERRGAYVFGDVYLRVWGPLGMIQRPLQIPLAQTVKVYPGLKEAANFTMLVRRGRLQQAGIRTARLQGIGRDFESLRDYQPDDEMRRIDWKATARRGKLVSRQYEVEKSQTVILALDVGRTMRGEIHGKQKLDYAIHAALMLAHVASLTDDNVGLLVFADTVQTYLPPRKGRAQVYAILEALYNLEASLTEPDYRVAMGYLRTHWRRRSLLVCFTDIWDPDSSRLTINELASLQPRHLVAAVTLLDTRDLLASTQTVHSVESLYTKAVATQVLDDRTRATNALSQRGVLVIDSPADSLSAALVNRYLEVKERMLL